MHEHEMFIFEVSWKTVGSLGTLTWDGMVMADSRGEELLWKTLLDAA